MDNNPLTYILTTAKLDATGQRWVASLANYNFKIFYRSGKLNLEADALSRIPWENTLVNHVEPFDCENYVTLKACHQGSGPRCLSTTECHTEKYCGG